MRFGLDDGKEHTLEEVGQELHVTRERIRQIAVSYTHLESLAGTSGFAGTGILSDRDDYFAECGSIHLQMYGLHDGWSHPAGKKDDAPSASWRQESAERIQSVFLAGRHIQYSDFVAE